jgi:PAS domain S-box-containing protein
MDETGSHPLGDSLPRGDLAMLRFAAAIDAISDAVYLIDRSTMRFVHANKAACDFLGKTREQMLDTDPWAVLSLEREELEAIYDAMIASGLPAAPIETQLFNKDGGYT